MSNSPTQKTTDRELQRRIGHGNRSSTERYVHVFAADAAEPADILAAIGTPEPSRGDTELANPRPCWSMDADELIRLLPAA